MDGADKDTPRRLMHAENVRRSRNLQKTNYVRLFRRNCDALALQGLRRRLRLSKEVELAIPQAEQFNIEINGGPFVPEEARSK